MEDALNNQSTETSGGTNWFSSLVSAGAGAYAANRNAAAATANAAAARNSNSAGTPPNWTLIGGIGGAVLVLLVVLFAFKK